MSTYLILLNWTDQGIRDVKQSPDRLQRAEGLFQQLGARLTGFYLTMGDYDMVAIVEAPDDETIARAVLTLGMQGSVRSKTLKAFTRDEYQTIIGSLG